MASITFDNRTDLNVYDVSTFKGKSIRYFYDCDEIELLIITQKYLQLP